LFWFLGFGAVIFAIITTWQSLGGQVNSRANRARASLREVTTRRMVRLGLDAAVVIFGFIWVSFISPNDTWKGGACVEIGCAFAAMELVVYMFESRSLRAARPCGYALVALYGVLAWMRPRLERARGVALRRLAGPQDDLTPKGEKHRHARRPGASRLRMAHVDELVNVARLDTALSRPLACLDPPASPLQLGRPSRYRSRGGCIDLCPRLGSD
jgi:hypothetical protein